MTRTDMDLPHVSAKLDALAIADELPVTLEEACKLFDEHGARFLAFDFKPSWVPRISIQRRYLESGICGAPDPKDGVFPVNSAPFIVYDRSVSTRRGRVVGVEISWNGNLIALAGEIPAGSK